jgi:hypothetical protein
MTNPTDTTNDPTGSKEYPSCAERIGGKMESRMADIRELWEHYPHRHPELGRLENYGLCFEYVEADRYPDLDRGFFRWQLSTGGPAAEIRFHMADHVTEELGWDEQGADASDLARIEFRFHDWFDGAGRTLTGADRELLDTLFSHFFRMVLGARFNESTGHARRGPSTRRRR